MYDHELTRYIEERNYNLSKNEYIYVCSTCPQINHVSYNAWSDTFEMWSDAGVRWEFKVYKEKKDD